MADSPATTCRKSGRKITPPNSAQPTSSASPEPIAKMRLRNRRNGSSGCSTYASQRTNAAISTAPAAVSPAAAASHACAPPSWTRTSASRSRLTPAISSAAPAKSIRAGRCTGGSRSTTQITASAAPPTGRLIRNTQRQVVWSTMKPPSSGPMTLANIQTPAR